MRMLAPLCAAALACAGPGQAPPGERHDGTPDAGTPYEPAPLIRERPYIAYVPVNYLPGTPAPLLVMFHGMGSTAEAHEAWLHLSALADEKTFLYAYPRGTVDVTGKRFWEGTDACCDIWDSKVDDVAYASAVIDDMEARYSVDPRRIYLFGHSNGGYMVHRLACDIGPRLAGVVSLAGLTYKDAAKCKTTSRLAVLQIHGDADENMNYNGGSVGAPWMAPYPSAHETVALWGAKNGCGALASTGQTLDLDSKLAGAETTVERYGGCTAGAVELWTIRGGRHQPALNPRWYEPVWAFLSAHPKP
jgi:polyhydroxybutyrate depolymerase